MEDKNQNIQMLELMDRAALYVEDGRIVHANTAASRYLLRPGMDFTPLLATGQEEYAAFSQGYLHLTIRADGFPLDATVIRNGSTDIVLLETAMDLNALRALSLAALELRLPLSNACAIADRVLPLAVEENRENAQMLAAQLNRRMLQMQRIIGNMSDCGSFGQENPRAMECVEICGLLEEQLSRAAEALAQAGFTLEWSLPQQRVYTLAYPQKIERAVYNMLSNAAKFSPPGSVIRAQLIHKGARLAFSVTDQGPGTENAGDVFTRYLRQPGLEDPRLGLGLGMVLIRAAAALHGGAVLLDHPEDAGTRITMTLSVNRSSAPEVHSPVLRLDYAGEKDHCLLELSDVLPAELYSIQNMG